MERVLRSAIGRFVCFTSASPNPVIPNIWLCCCQKQRCQKGTLVLAGTTWPWWAFPRSISPHPADCLKWPGEWKWGLGGSHHREGRTPPEFSYAHPMVTSLMYHTISSPEGTKLGGRGERTLELAPAYTLQRSSRLAYLIVVSFWRISPTAERF